MIWCKTLVFDEVLVLALHPRGPKSPNCWWCSASNQSVNQSAAIGRRENIRQNIDISAKRSIYLGDASIHFFAHTVARGNDCRIGQKSKPLPDGYLFLEYR
ncbi:hypothetical protein E2C01_046274 [Portunus trituberculatus]|uniref:Uncharacterized protein n=1 Tax=Portunus trituberculatus TaxID=210409 RepID=A0A5B7G3Y7_PORTR|nr:hypothetical protein [Portunus trituberculatus]